MIMPGVGYKINYKNCREEFYENIKFLENDTKVCCKTENIDPYYIYEHLKGGTKSKNITKIFATLGVVIGLICMIDKLI